MFKQTCAGIVLGVLFFNVAFAENSTSTNQELLNFINQLQAQVQSLQAKVANLQSQVQSVKIELKFSRALVRGTKGDDVKQLQEFLKTFPDVYPDGLVTGYFGPLTEMAVKRFQEKNGIESIGIVGPKTQAKLNELVTVGAGQSGVIPPGLTFTDNPASVQMTSSTPPSPTATPQPTPLTDVTPPVVSSVTVSSSTPNSVLITWVTNEPATGSVNYGSTPSNWAVTPTNTSYATWHSFTLSNLTSGTLYTFRVYSTDVTGNGPQGYPPEYTFTTPNN